MEFNLKNNFLIKTKLIHKFQLKLKNNLFMKYMIKLLLISLILDINLGHKSLILLKILKKVYIYFN